MKNQFFNFTSKIAGVLPPLAKKFLYRLGPITKVVRSFLNKISPVGLSVVTIAAGGNQGMRMELDLQSEKDYWLGTYEMDLQKVIQQKVQKDWVVYDVGANIGYFSLFFSRVVGKNGRVFSFEPFPSNLERLKKNLRLNDLQDHVTVVPYAVIQETREIEFLVGASGAMGKASGSAGREDINAYGNSIEVQGVSLDDWVYHREMPPPNAIKMDIEGGEILALRGMERLFKEIRPIFFLELHGESAARVAWTIFHASGYKLCQMIESLPEVESFEKLSWKSYLVAFP